MKKLGIVRTRPLILGILLLISATLLPPTSGQQAVGAGATSPPSETPIVATSQTPKTTLADFAWLAGRWQGAWGPRVAQQIWTAPQAGVMLGTFQLTEGDKTLVLELFTMVEETDGIKLYIRHFTPSLVAWEKTGPTTLRLQTNDAKSIVFVNAVDGQPKQSVMTHVDPDTYTSRSEIVPEKGDSQITEITYHRATDGATPKHKEKKPKPSK
jgi:Domain of unknown function (DUF6265)